MGRSSLSKLFDNAVPPWIYVSKALRRPATACKSSTGSYQNLVLATLQCAHQLETDSFRFEVNTNTKGNSNANANAATTTAVANKNNDDNGGGDNNKNKNCKFNKSRGVQYKGDCHLILCKNSSQLQTESLRLEVELEEEEEVRGQVDAPESSSSSSSTTTTSSSNEECHSSTIAITTTTSTSTSSANDTTNTPILASASQLAAARESTDMEDHQLLLCPLYCSSSSSSLLSYGFSDSSSSGMNSSSLLSSEGAPYNTNLSHLHYNYTSSLSHLKPLNQEEQQEEGEEEEEEELSRFSYGHSCPISGVWRSNPIFQRGVSSADQLVKYSEDPYLDFCSSIAEMIAASQMWNKWDQIEEMLQCYLRLNSPQHHSLIKLAFLHVLTHI